ncbi:MAG: hypothetical protein M1828_000830 [Chrysothrix sp. TS-e1954]|nr:MAG: hypothetical protein M1828_000830 [Chrysothrix sp. TS-e1954]
MPSNTTKQRTSTCDLDLTFRGFVRGLTYLDQQDSHPLCRYFGGIPYALPPVGPYRWRKPRPLPACYRYGTRSNPGNFTGGAALCPQVGIDGKPAGQGYWDEDCLQLNMWIPVGQAPDEGWPVLVYLHGGWLQFGSPNTLNPTALLSETSCRCIIVCPAYRLNVFGFLASQDMLDEARANGEGSIVGNYGFWDQRLAIEWTHKNVSYFGGDASNITLSGYSAVPSSGLIRRTVMFSNGAGTQPKSLQLAQLQFKELIDVLDILPGLSAKEKMTKLRQVTPERLIDAASKMRFHEFRAVTDGLFVDSQLFAKIDNGEYAAMLNEQDKAMLIGECEDERHMYGVWRPPHKNSREALRQRLCADYAPEVVEAALNIYSPHGNLPSCWGSPCSDWNSDAFGRAYADLQVHAMERGFINALDRGGVDPGRIRRYRIEWRAQCVDSTTPKQWGVTHTTDMPIWFFGNAVGDGLTAREKGLVKDFAGKMFWDFVTNHETGPKNVHWPHHDLKSVVRLKSDGMIDRVLDKYWNNGVNVWHKVRTAQKTESSEMGSRAKI